MTETPQLPPELLRQIIRDPDIQRRDLYNLSLANRTLSAEAYLALYETVVLEEPHSMIGALDAFNSFTQIADIVRHLVLRISPSDFGESWFTLSEKAVNGIHNMSNLQELDLNYLWASNPHAPSLKSRGGQAWTRTLKIPQVKTLCINTSTYRPFREIFGELAYPLPRLETIRPVHVSWIDGIAQLTCERIYGQTDIELNSLKVLEVYNLESFSLGRLMAPNLETVALVSGYLSPMSIGWESWTTAVNCVKNVKKIGPIFFSDTKERFLSFITQLTNLEVILLVFETIQWRDFGVEILQRLLLSCPRLRQVSVACVRFEDLGGKVKQIKTFERDIADVTGTSGSVEGVPQWEVSIERVQIWKEAIRMVLELD